ncbi:hypothetical protein PFICI_09559 [Pestalotiopsis fici W106-1]|uniref:Uncharacterized protein n=1 Tax=Pestalotiopsis fici (strain W106-1 / CGMCC3.15140) TaxID=1229662 RepID=W3X3I5_PESFW|nr:uncharacterized protein PFICI_09559 [Pestalotiopsis fici W106-1]ETS79706.1 hypothetical protein PFICI_09559 [Pestalotiopsis fici W106-1]
MSANLAVTGSVLKRFTQTSTLLWLLDPVRGEPTIHNLDRHPSDTHQGASERKTSKFLDSIALLFATRKDGDTVSAATLEEGQPEGTIIRIASNAGVEDDTLEQVRAIVNILNHAANGPQRGGTTSLETENQILLRVIELDIEKISHYLSMLQRSSGDIAETVDWILANPGFLGTLSAKPKSDRFLEWITYLRSLIEADNEPDHDQIMVQIQWAVKGKWSYGPFLEAACKARGKPVAPWVVNIYKLGRYAVASKVLLSFVAENCDLLCPILVEAIEPPPKQLSSLPRKENNLELTLRRSHCSDIEDLIMRLGQAWNVTNPEGYLQKKGSGEDLVVHAELQLINFYDHNLERMPRHRLIGVSKKSCFLCNEFLKLHSTKFSVSACHQKLYRSWCPPFCSDNLVYQKYKTLITSMSDAMETAIKHQIEQRLGVGARRPYNLDSTAGVSLSIFSSDPVRHGFERVSSPSNSITQEGSIHSPTATQSVITYASSSAGHEGSSTHASLTDAKYARIVGGSMDKSQGEHMDPKLVFHVTRADDRVRQDLVSTTSLIDQTSRRPSWGRLCATLARESQFGVGFDDAKEFLLVNQNLRVGNDCQFAACIDYLQNARSWNNEVLVFSYEDLARVQSNAVGSA